MKWNVLKAIFRRDFVSYFSSPTGYVFICVFVVLSALATFWPPEFFANNLANLDQLSRWLPFIMLVFIPAITMSIWAEERRQGTDELLLTIPASDFDVVLGKYLAGVAIFTVSLLFSALAIFTVFKYGLGDPDPGLFVSTYLGYWFIGAAMIAIGMVASFLTANLTVGFILGTLFNLPLALFGVADWFVKDPHWAESVRRWSAQSQFGDFERGVISLGGVTYFVMIAVVMIYLSMVLIGRRHWQAREDGQRLGFHYALRALALLVLAVGVTALVQSRNALRADISSAKLSTLSPDTVELLQEIRDTDKIKPIKIDAYVSPQMPSEYAAMKLNLLSTLEEFKALGGGKIRVEKHEIPNYGPEAELAEKNFGITPQTQVVQRAGEPSTEEFFMGLAITSGLDKVVTPFINKGIPIEYELVRSIVTVSDDKRMRIGVVDTGIRMMNPDGGGADEWPLITELRKQYDVISVDPSKPIKGNFDALVAVQPSMLAPQSFDHVVDAIRGGTPTAVFEDPFPYFYPQFVPGTAEPKQSQMGGMSMFGGMPPEPKGDVEQLWRLLGVKMNPTEVVWQDYAPESSVRTMQDPQWLFIDDGNGALAPFNQDLPISSGLNQLLLLYAGGITKDAESKLDFQPILETSNKVSGSVQAMTLQRFESQGLNPNREAFGRQRTKDGAILAAQIEGTPPEEDASLTAAAADDEHDPADDPQNKATAEKKAPKMKVVLVSDIDWVIPSFFFIREGGDAKFLPATQNVTFVLNVIDSLAGDERFVAIRKRTREHRTLARIDAATEESRIKSDAEEDAFIKEITDKEDEARAAMEKKIKQVEESQTLTEQQRAVLMAQTQIQEQRKLDEEARALASQSKRKLKQIEYDLQQQVRGVQDKYKLYAILIPPIPPLLLALAVFFRRRELERQGVSRERLR